jgi:hypothetical protein
MPGRAGMVGRSRREWPAARDVAMLNGVGWYSGNANLLIGERNEDANQEIGVPGGR